MQHPNMLLPQNKRHCLVLSNKISALISLNVSGSADLQCSGLTVGIQAREVVTVHCPTFLPE